MNSNEDHTKSVQFNYLLSIIWSDKAINFHIDSTRLKIIKIGDENELKSKKEADNRLI